MKHRYINHLDLKSSLNFCCYFLLLSLRENSKQKMKEVSVVVVALLALGALMMVGAAGAEVCCRRQPSCLCAFPEPSRRETTKLQRRLVTGAVEFIRVNKDSSPAPNLFGVRHKAVERTMEEEEEKKEKDSNDEDSKAVHVQDHLMHWLWLDVDIIAYHPVLPAEVAFDRQTRSLGHKEVQQKLDAGLGLPRLSVNKHFVVYPNGAEEEEDADEAQPSQPFIPFDPSMSVTEDLSLLPQEKRWFRVAKLRFVINESSILKTPVLFALRWAAPNKEEGSDEGYVLPATVNVSLVKTLWAPRGASSMTLEEGQVRYWSKNIMKVVTDPVVLAAIRQEEEDKLDQPLSRRVWRYFQLTSKRLVRAVGGEGNMAAIAVAFVTFIVIKGLRGVASPLKRFFAFVFRRKQKQQTESVPGAVNDGEFYVPPPPVTTAFAPNEDRARSISTSYQGGEVGGGPSGVPGTLGEAARASSVRSTATDNSYYADASMQAAAGHYVRQKRPPLAPTSA